MVPKAKARCIANITMAKLKPADFALATRAMHLKYKVQANVGVKLRKLHCAGARAVRGRQRQGVKRFFDGSARALHQQDEGKRRQVHVSYSHLWDEVRAAFRWRPSERYRKIKRNTPASSRKTKENTIVQQQLLQLHLQQAQRAEHQQKRKANLL